MLAAAKDPIFTERLELRRTRREDAAAMFEALRDPSAYAYIPRSAPTSVADIDARFARVMQETAPDRLDQWLNWTVWLRESGEGIGLAEATVDPSNTVAIGYQFDPRVWGRGYAREAVGAMIEHLRATGALSFSAYIDIRNTASKKLVAALGFKHVETKGADEFWRRT